MPTTSFDGSDLFARIAHELAEQPDLSHTNQRIVELAVQLTGCSLAALWSLASSQHASGQHASLQAVTDQAAGRLLRRIMDEVDEGPARTVLLSRQTTLVDDLRTEARWPRSIATMTKSELDIRSAVGFALTIGERQPGALMLYSPQPGYFTEEHVHIGSILADHAVIALDAAINADKAEHLRMALESNRRIGMAIGILMALHRVSDTQAFDMLRIASQHTHVKLREVAEEVILTGAAPDWPARRPA
jgi:GAF domain-containing protein